MYHLEPTKEKTGYKISHQDASHDVLSYAMIYLVL